MQAGLEGPQLAGMHCLRHLPASLTETAEVRIGLTYALHLTTLVCNMSQQLCIVFVVRCVR